MGRFWTGALFTKARDHPYQGWIAEVDIEQRTEEDQNKTAMETLSEK